METIGQRLRQGRERLGLSLEEAERTTHIRAQHLAALERDEFEALPSPVQARGFLKNYADYLGLDTERLLQDYGAASPAARRSPPTRPPGSSTRAEVRVRRRGWFSADLLVAGSIALGALALLIWGGGRLMASLRSAAAPADQNAAAPVPTVTATPTATLEPAAASLPNVFEAPTATVTLPPLNLPGSGVSIRLLVVQRAWVRALADGEQRYQGRAEPGFILDLAGDRQIEVTTGNGAGLRLTLNGTDLGLMGGLDEALTRIWTPAGEISPTPTVTPTPTATLRPSATPAGVTPLGPTG